MVWELKEEWGWEWMVVDVEVYCWFVVSKMLVLFIKLCEIGFGVVLGLLEVEVKVK